MEEGSAQEHSAAVHLFFISSAAAVAAASFYFRPPRFVILNVPRSTHHLVYDLFFLFVPKQLC